MADPKTNLLENQIDYDEVAQELDESYRAIEAQDMSRTDVLPPKDKVSTGSDIANILFADELATVGLQIDRNKVKWDLEKAADFWVDHPLRAAWAAATALVPMVGGINKVKRAGRLANMADDIVKESGYLDDAADLALVAEKDRELMKINIDAITRRKERMDRIEMLGDAAPIKDKIFYQIDKAFRNTYLDDIDPTNAYNARAEWQKSITTLLKEDGRLSGHLKDLPPDDPILGLQIVKFLDDPAELKNIPDKYKDAAIRLVDDFKETDLAALGEGFISAEESKRVGGVWYSTVRADTAIDSGNMTTILDRTSTGKARALRVPKTQSPNLLERKASKEEVKGYVTKQYAAELLAKGQPEEAIKLLGDKPGYEAAKKLINDGEYGSAINALTAHGKIDFTPKSLTFNSLFNKKVLLNNYRMIRDLSLNGDITKSSDYYSTLAISEQKNWMKLDTLPGADRLRRMVAVSKGLKPEEVTELGWVKKSVFRELKELTDGTVNEGMGGLMSYLTAVHKTASTAFNIPTHWQNVGGNFASLVAAGVNPFTPDFIKLQKDSASAIWQMMQANRRGENVTEIKNLGKVKSLINDKEFDIAEELNSAELESIIEKSSILAAEGISVLDQMAKSDNFVGTLAKLTNKAAKISKGYLASDLYSAEDAMTKMAYFLNLRQRGFSRAAAAIEVGKRLPMYHSIGAGPKTLRSWALPWVSFPAEMSRILKNNAIDHPLKTAMMLQFPDFAQLGAYGAARAAGQPMSYEGIQQRKDQLASWAYRPSSIMTPILDRNKDFRAMVLDFLPYTALAPATLSSQAPLFKQLPFGMDEPMPILNGLYTAMTGRDTWGREVPTDPNNPSQKVAIMATSLMGFVAPPIMNKYLFNVNDPELGYRFLTDMGKNVNPYTEKQGDPVFDFFVNNLTNFKMYPASPEQQMSNEAFKKENLTNYRAKLSKEWAALLKSGDVESAAERMREIRETFAEQYNNPYVTQAKEIEWLKNHTKSIRNHPQLRGFSKEEIRYQLQDKEQAAGNLRTGAMQQLIDAHRNELAKRGRKSNRGARNPFLPNGLD